MKEQNHENKSRPDKQDSRGKVENPQSRDGAERETKDGRGGNHNPKGASGYTSGRVDDRGRKSEAEAFETSENTTQEMNETSNSVSEQGTPDYMKPTVNQQPINKEENH
jgi:hypothetical protein